jgi:hypothetical protein
MDDVISQGPDPDREPRSRLPRHWRIGAGILLAAAVGVAAIVLAPRHVAIRPAPGATNVPPASVVPAIINFSAQGNIPAPPLPRNNASIVVCSPSTGTCSVRLNVRALKAEYKDGNTGTVLQSATPIP